MKTNFPDGAVVTRNYKERNSDHPWLVRALNQTSEDALPSKTVIAENVSFKPTDRDSRERKLGCTMLASCTKAEAYTVEPFFSTEGMLRLAYCGDHFMDIATYKKITELAVLYLDKDGHIYGEPHKVLDAPVTGSENAEKGEKKWEPVGT